MANSTNPEPARKHSVFVPALAGSIVGTTLVAILVAASEQWSIKDTVSQLLSFVGVFLGALGGAYFADVYARRHQSEIDERNDKEELEAVRSTLGTGLVANLITLETIVQEYNRSGFPLVGTMYTGHFNVDHLMAARALGADRYRDFILVANLVEVCNARHQANHEIETRLRNEILMILHKPLALWGPEDHEAIRRSMRPYMIHFQQYAKKLETEMRDLLECVAPERIKDVNEGVARLRFNVATGRDPLEPEPRGHADTVST